MSRRIRVHQSHLSDKSQFVSSPQFKEQAIATDQADTGAPLNSVERSGSAHILQLQSTVGNQAVRRLLAAHSAAGQLQREDEAEDAGETPLSRPQAAAAVSFYRSQPRRYTPDIITQIQEAVGTPKTGVISTADTQAVANWQKKLNETEKPPLKVDGMAGPRTLPTLFRNGLAAQDQIESYSGEAHDILDQWDDLGTAEARINALVAKVNEYLTAANVPTCDPQIDDAEGNLGQFDFPTWKLDIGKPAFAKDDPTPAEKADMADTIYHESRHAEQWYRMAQFQASQGKSAQQIAHDMGIPKKIADKAFADPLKKGSMDALIAEGWNESVYGSRAAFRNKVLKELAAAGKALEKAQEEFDKNPTPANKQKLKAADARDDKAREDYFNLPEENDANRIGGRVTKAYMENEPEEEAVAP